MGNGIHVGEKERHIRFWLESMVRVRHEGKFYGVSVGESGACET